MKVINHSSLPPKLQPLAQNGTNLLVNSGPDRLEGLYGTTAGPSEGNVLSTRREAQRMYATRPLRRTPLPRDKSRTVKTKATPKLWERCFC